MLKGVANLLTTLTCLLACGCGQPMGVVFPPTVSQLVWPSGEQPARIRYVGQLTANEDLKPGKSSLDAIGQAIFGKPDRHALVLPFAVCTDGADRVFVADSSAKIVHVFDLNSRHYAQWKPKEKEPQFSQPVGIAWDARGRLLVSDSVAGTIFVLDGQGRYQGQIGKGALKRPCGISVQPATGRIYVADSAAHQIVIFSPTGEEVARLGRRGTSPGEFNFPIDVTVDHQGRIYVADALNSRVQQIAPDLKTFRVIAGRGDTPGSFAQPKCLSVDNEDHLYVVDNRFEAVQIFDPDGQLLLNFGQEGHGPGEFWLPTGIFIDAKNRIWIADSYNKRVQVFDYLSVAPTAAISLPEKKQ